LDNKLNDGDNLKTNEDSTHIAEKCRRIANSLLQSLLDPKEIPPNKRLYRTPNPSPAEKYVLQVCSLLHRNIVGDSMKVFN